MLIGVASLCGCANDADRTRAEGAGAGAVGGALLGGLLGHGKAGNVAAGVVGGGVVGGLYGNYVANQKSAYAAREDQLQASIAHAQQVTQQSRAYNQQLQQQIADLERTRDALKRQTMTADARRAALQNDKRTTRDMLQNTNNQLASVKQEITRQQTLLRTASAEKTSSQGQPPPIEQISTNITDLQAEARELERAQSQLQMIDQRRSY